MSTYIYRNTINKILTQTYIANTNGISNIPITVNYNSVQDIIFVYYSNIQLNSDNYSVVDNAIVLTSWSLNSGDKILIQIHTNTK